MSKPLSQDLDAILVQTPHLWEPLRNCSVFITGGTGFVGTWLTEALAWADTNLNLGIRVVLLTRNPEKFRTKSPFVAEHQSFELLRGDSLDFSFPSGHFQYVIHAATESLRTPCPDSPEGSFTLDVKSTRRVLEFARSAGARRLLFTSSGAVYGSQPRELVAIPEDFPGAPSTIDSKSAYGQAKRVSEFLCSMHARQFGFDALIARLFAFVGPHLPLEGYAIGNFVRDVLNDATIQIESDGSTVRSYLYGADLAVWLWTILLRGESLRPYNVGSPHPITVRELAERVAATAGRSSKVEVLGRPGVPATRYVPDTTRAEKELGLKVNVSLDESLKRTLNWHCSRTAQLQN